MAVSEITVIDSQSVERTVNTLPALGTAADTGGLPVAFTTEGKAQLGAVTETAPATDTASSGLNGRLQRIAQRITSLIALFPSSVGQKAKADALAVTLASDEDVLTNIGATNETAASSDTATSGLNGRLQRIAQRLTSLIALLPSSLGAKTGSASLSVVPASDATFQSNISGVNGREYETVAASATDQVLGATGAAGDDLDGILIIPATTAAGAVSIKDGSGSAISIFAGGGTTALTTLIPFYVPIGARSTSGAWKVTTGANVSAIGFGNFT